MAPLIGTSWHGAVDVCRLDLILDVPLANRTTIVVCLLEQPGNKSDHSWRWKFFWVLLFVWLWRWQWLFLLPRPIPVECRGETSVEEAVVLVRALFGANMMVRQNYQKYPRYLILDFKFWISEMFDCPHLASPVDQACAGGVPAVVVVDLLSFI